MNSRLRTLLAALALVLSTALPLAAQTRIATGDIVLLTDAGGRQLAASLPQKLYLSPNTDAWEQWEYQGGQLRSFHGTMIINDRGFGHGPSSTSDPARVSVMGVKWSGSQYSFTDLVDGGEGVLQSMSPFPMWWVSAGGAELMAFGGLNNLPNGTAFRVRKVASPRLPRQAAKTPLTENAIYSIRSFHGTFIGEPNAKSGVRIDAIHAPKATPYFKWDLKVGRDGASSPSSDRVLHVGDQMTILVDFGGGHMSSLMPGGTKLDSGLESVAFIPGRTAAWTLVAEGYASGNRLPADVPFSLRSAAGTHISADPARTGLHLSPNASGWEWWTLKQ